MDRLERILQTDLAYLMRGGFWLGVGQVVASVSVFILAIAFANLVPKDIYGTYKYVQAIAGILAIAGMSGMNTYIAQAVARGAEGTFLSGLRARIRYGYLGAAGGIVVALYYLWMHNVFLAEAFCIVAAAMPFMDALGLYNVYLQSKKYFKESILYFSVVQILSVAVIFIAVLYTTNLIVLVAAYFLPPVALRLYFHLRTIKHYPPNEIDDPKAIRYGAHLSVINVLGTLASYIDSIVLFHLLGPISVALYSFALAPVDQIRTLYSKNLPALAIPKLANRTMRDIDRMLIRRMVLLAVLGILIVIAYVLLVPYVFQLVFAKYLDAVFLSKLLALLLIVALPATYLAAVTQAKIHVMPTSWLYLAVIPDILHILALVLFIPLYGIYGVIIAKAVDAVSAFILSFIQWIFLRTREA